MIPKYNPGRSVIWFQLLTLRTVSQKQQYLVYTHIILVFSLEIEAHLRKKKKLWINIQQQQIR